MNRKRKDAYTKEELDYLKEIADMTGRTNEEITKMFNTKFNQSRTVTAIIGAKSRHNIKSYTKVYTQEQLDYLREITSGRTNKEITTLFNKKFNENKTESSIGSIRIESGIRTGNTGRFEKGNSPANSLPIGSETVRKDDYLYVKIDEPNIWKAKHHIIWEEQNGSILKGNVVIFGDSNKRNFDINNLILVSKQELLTLNRNNLIQKDANLTRTAVMVAKLQQKINERKRK